MWTQTYKPTDLILYEGIAVAQSLLLPFPNLALCLLRRSTVGRAFEDLDRSFRHGRPPPSSAALSEGGVSFMTCLINFLHSRVGPAALGDGRASPVIPKLSYRQFQLLRQNHFLEYD
jgi:hypothetical protein